MPTQIFSRLEDKFVRLLDDQRLETGEIDRVVRMIQNKRAKNLPFAHSLHLNVIRDDMPLHLRVLAFSNPKWKTERLKCLEDHAALYKSVSRRKVSFRVPRLVAWGESPLLWDLTEYVEATNLPWSFPGGGKLTLHLDKVETFFDIDRALSRSRLANVHVRDFRAFSNDVSRWASWASRVQIIDQDEAFSVKRFVKDFVETSLSRNRIVVSHGDYNPSNILFADNSLPWLIDFDHLRRSVAGEAIARLATVTYRERKWSDRVIGLARECFVGPEWDGFIISAWWHTLNLWRCYFQLWAPVKGVGSLQHLEELTPGVTRQIHLQHKMLLRI